MIEPAEFLAALEPHQISFFAGVPDSLLAGLIAKISASCEPEKHVVCANEGSAIALACGHYLATNNIGCVYMQNSGLGNSINPLVSLADSQVYGIPVLLVIGWRGEPGVEDEPQHKKQGAITQDLLKVLGIAYSVIDTNTNIKDAISIAVSSMRKSQAPYALLVKKGAFKDGSNSASSPDREKVIDLLVNTFSHDAAFIATTGKIGRELFEVRLKNQQPSDSDFLCIGGMGHASQVALGISLSRPEKQVICLDGDGAALMHLGHLATIAHLRPKRLTHFLLNNGVHDSVGGQPTTNPDLNFHEFARQLGYAHTFQCPDLKSLEELLPTLKELDGPIFIEVLLQPGSRTNLGRPTIKPQDAKDRFMRYLNT